MPLCSQPRPQPSPRSRLLCASPAPAYYRCGQSGPSRPSPAREGEPRRQARNWRVQSVQRTGVRLLRRRPGTGKREQCLPCSAPLTELTHGILTEKAGEKRGCCGPPEAPLTSLDQGGAPLTPGKQTRTADHMMLKGASGTGLEASANPSCAPSPQSAGLWTPCYGLCPRISCLSQILSLSGNRKQHLSLAGGM